MLAPRSTSQGSRARSPRGSVGLAKWWRRAPRARPSTACARRPLVFPDDADDNALHDDVALVQAQRLHRIISGLQPNPAAGLPVKALHRGALSMDERDHRLAGLGLVSLLHDDIVAVLDVLVDHRVAANLQDVAAPAPGQELVGHRDRFITGDGFDRSTRSHQTQQRQLRRAALTLGGDHLDRPALVVGPPDVAFALEIGEVFMHRCERLEPKLAGNFLEARGISLFPEMFRDVIKDFALASRDRHTGSRRFTEP